MDNLNLSPATKQKLAEVRAAMDGAEERAKTRHDEFTKNIRLAMDSLRQESEFDYQAIRQGQRELEQLVAADLAVALQPAAPPTA